VKKKLFINWICPWNIVRLSVAIEERKIIGDEQIPFSFFLFIFIVDVGEEKKKKKNRNTHRHLRNINLIRVVSFFLSNFKFFFLV
jgi:hypothetical protein